MKIKQDGLAQLDAINISDYFQNSEIFSQNNNIPECILQLTLIIGPVTLHCIAFLEKVVRCNRLYEKSLSHGQPSVNL